MAQWPPWLRPVQGTVVSSPLEKSTGTTTASPATLQLERRERNNLRGSAPKYRSTCIAKFRKNKTRQICLHGVSKTSILPI